VASQSNQDAHRVTRLPWPAQLPEGWEIRKLKRVAGMRSGDSIAGERVRDSGQYPVYGGNGIRGWTDGFTHDGRFVLVGRQGALCGNVHRASGSFWASEHAVVATPDTDIHPTWFFYLLRAMDLGQYSQAAAQPGLAVERILDLYVPVPPRTSQEAIAEFLDRECARIDDLGSELRATRDVLADAERRLIDDVMPQPGTQRLGWYAEVRTGLTLGKSYPADQTSEFPYLRVANVQSDRIDLAEVKTVAVPEDEAARVRLALHDVLMTEGGDIDKLGRGAVWLNQIDPCLHQNHVFAVRTHAERLDPFFLAYATRTSAARQYFERTATRSTNLAATNSSKVRSWRLSVPSLSEQRSLVRRLDARLTKLYEARAELTAMMSSITAYRDALITEAATGRLDVSRRPHSEMDESLIAVREGEPPEVFA
jgi:type I restriction enzyme S subunit